ncbi:SEC14-like protein 2 [Haemaphysalis longicornis]
MSGYLPDLDERQRIALEQFREAVQDVRQPVHTDANLLRWLRAREFDVTRAEHMFRQHLRWRQQRNVDKLLTDYVHDVPKVMRDHFPGGILDCCPKGNPVWLINIGSVDIKGYLQVLPKADVYRHCMYLLEKQEKIKRDTSSKLGKEIETQYVIMDFENFSLRQVYSWQVLNLLVGLLKMYEANFPESLEKAFVINVPSFFPTLWKMVRPLLTERTVSKVAIYGKDGWKPALLEFVDASRLPEYWGGTLTGPDGDPRCPNLVCPGGEVPDEFRESLAAKKLWGREGVQQRNVERRGRFELPVRVEEAGSRLRWAFQTAKGDLAFGVRFEPFPGDPDGDAHEQLLEIHRVPPCSLLPDENSHVCARPGTYVLQFDNSFSWVIGKDVAYEVHVEPPPPPAS